MAVNPYAYSQAQGAARMPQVGFGQSSPSPLYGGGPNQNAYANANPAANLGARFGGSSTGGGLPLPGSPPPRYPQTGGDYPIPGSLPSFPQTGGDYPMYDPTLAAFPAQRMAISQLGAGMRGYAGGGMGGMGGMGGGARGGYSLPNSPLNPSPMGRAGMTPAADQLGQAYAALYGNRPRAYTNPMFSYMPFGGGYSQAFDYAPRSQYDAFSPTNSLLR